MGKKKRRTLRLEMALALKAKGYSNKQIADLFGVSPKRVWRVLNGR